MHFPHTPLHLHSPKFTMIQIVVLSVICAAPSHLLPILAGVIPLLGDFSFFPLPIPLQPKYILPPVLPPPPPPSSWFFSLRSTRINVVVATSLPTLPSLPTPSITSTSRRFDYLFACGVGLIFTAPFLVHLLCRWFRVSAQKLTTICILVCTMSISGQIRFSSFLPEPSDLRVIRYCSHRHNSMGTKCVDAIRLLGPSRSRSSNMLWKDLATYSVSHYQ